MDVEGESVFSRDKLPEELSNLKRADLNIGA